MNRTVQRTIEILDFISQHDRGVTLADVIRITGMPKTSAYDILRTLEDRHMIYRRDDQANSYSIGFRAFAIGGTYSRSSHLLTNAAHEMKHLAEKLGKTVLLCKEYDRKILYVDKCTPKGVLIMTPAAGELTDLGGCAAGMVFWAFGGKKSASLSQQKRECIRRQKYAVYIHTGGAPVYTIAAPVFNFENRLSGILTVMDLNHAEVDHDQEGKMTAACAEVISRKMGFQPAAAASEN